MDALDTALLLDRAVVGVFFAIAGAHKLLNAERHATLVRTLRDDGVPFVRVMQWFVPAVEVGAGAALAVGAWSFTSALLLGAICAVACTLDGIKRIREWAPVDAADWLCDLLYLPETLLGVLLIVTLLAGPGAYSVDALMSSAPEVAALVHV